MIPPGCSPPHGGVRDMQQCPRPSTAPRFLHAVSSLTGPSAVCRGPVHALPCLVSLPFARLEPFPHRTYSACGQRCGTCVKHVSDQIDGDDHSLPPPQPTDCIADALHPAVFLIQKRVPQRRSCFIQYPCLRFDPFTLWVTAHIARHYSDLSIMANPFHLPCVRE